MIKQAEPPKAPLTEGLATQLHELSAENRAVFRLARTTGVGMATLRKALQRCGSAANAVDQWDQLTQGKKPLIGHDKLEQELDNLAKLGGKLVVWGSPAYPPALAQLPDAPLVLSVLGNEAILHQRQIAVVGNRSASAIGLRWTSQLCTTLAAHVCITSGLARGIDTAAHTGALAANGSTLAVVAGGIDHVYPPENARLREQIIAQGCLVTEQPLGSTPTAQFFPRRNRIIAGLSIGVVIPEANRHSGSLITADYALSYGRDVWAVPGSPMDTRSSGPNYLLKQGAILVESAEDILQGLPERPAPFVLSATTFTPKKGNDGNQTELFSATANTIHEPETDHEGILSGRQRVWQLLGKSGISYDILLRESGMDGSALQMELTELELDGLAGRDLLGNWQRL